MNKTERIHARIDPVLKASAEAVFEKVGLSPTEAIRLFYKQVELHDGLPFSVNVPNKETLGAFRDLDRGINLSKYGSFAQLRKKLDV